MSEEVLLEFKNLSKSFDDKVVLNGINLTIPEGKMTAIIGKSGTGKSVMLKHVARLLEPDSGDIFYKGTSFSSLKGKKKKELKDKFSYMFQHNALFDSFTLFDNVALPLRETTRLSHKHIEEKVVNLLDQLELTEFRDNFMSQLSGGMQRRVALARALVTDPEVVLFDEPTTGLDPIRRNAVLNLISKYQKKLGFTSIIVSHDIPDAFYISDYVAIIEKGEVIFSGSPLQLEQKEDPLIHRFLNSHDSLIDELTGMTNPIDFQQRVQEILATESKGGSFVLVKVMNYDYVLKAIGEIAAQHVIKTIGTFVKEIFTNENEITARVSRSQIVTYVPENTSAEYVADKVQKLRELISNNALFCQDAIGRKCSEFSISHQIVPIGEMPAYGDFSFTKDKLEPLLEIKCKPGL